MYNRYIPQPDGTYRRNSMPDTSNSQPRTVRHPENSSRQEPPAQPCQPAEPEMPPCQNCVHHQSPARPAPPRGRKNAQPMGVGSFLKQLLPKDFNTEDLIIVLLLLLMAGDCQEDQNTALLTLVLYLFM